MNKKKRIRNFVIICMLLILMLACLSTGGTSSDLSVTVDVAPADIDVGDVFTIKLSMHNQGDYNVDISQIKLPDALLEGAILKGIDPPAIIANAEGGQTPFNLSTTIAPQGRETITFTFEAKQAGDFSGSGGVVVGSGESVFQVKVLVGGQTAVGTTPGSVGDQTPIKTGEIPYKSVVQISALVEVDDRELIGWTGSGTIISPDGLILTNAHVVLSDRFYVVKDLIVSLTVAQDAPPVQTYLASILQADARLDLAVIKIRADMNGNPVNSASLNLPAVPLGNSDSLQLGDSIVIIGYPGIGGETITLTRGEVSGFTSEEPYGNRAFVKTSATIAGGNSGGLAANSKGEIIGVPTQLGSGDVQAGFVDCRPLADTNRDGVIDNNDTCVPGGGFINALRPIKLAVAMIDAAKRGEVAVEAGSSTGEEYDPSGDVFFSDDFSDPSSGWYAATDSNGMTAYQNGEFVIEVTRTDYFIWSDINYIFDNIVMVVDARVINSVGDGDFGFICGILDNENFTVLEIAEDGYFAFWKYKNGEYVSLVEWTYSDEIANGSPYTLGAFCGTQKLALAVNGSLLAEYVDPEFQPGRIGLAVGCFDTSGIKIGFDNFVLLIQ